jgi:Uma2 family endonuclease
MAAREAERMEAAHASGRKLTYDDLLLLPDDGRRHELIDGEHFVTPSPFIRHQELLKRLAYAVESHVRAHPEQGQMFFAPLDCVLTAHDVVEPDLLVVTGDQQDILTDKHVMGVPALVVEILSAGSRRLDSRLKRAVYDRVGVREFWIVDPPDRAIVVHRRGPDGRLVAASRLGPGDALETPLLPGFTLPLDPYFA